MAKIEATKELFEKYRHHPRLLEIRFILLFDMLDREYGYAGARKIVSAICDAFNRNGELLDAVIDKRFDIKRKKKTSKIKWTQEIIFMGLCYGETAYKIAKDYMSVSPANFYRKVASKAYNINEFLTDEWLRDLDDEVKVTGNYIYRNEVKGFLEIIGNLREVLLKWGGLSDEGGN